jgi:hypothetical protein
VLDHEGNEESLENTCTFCHYREHDTIKILAFESVENCALNNRDKVFV